MKVLPPIYFWWWPCGGWFPGKNFSSIHPVVWVEISWQNWNIETYIHRDGGRGLHWLKMFDINIYWIKMVFILLSHSIFNQTILELKVISDFRSLCLSKLRLFSTKMIATFLFRIFRANFSLIPPKNSKYPRLAFQKISPPAIPSSE